MKKINKEEYEILKALDEEWKWIARDRDRLLFVFNTKPRKGINYDVWDILGWDEDEYKEVKDNTLFQFTQWEDEEPHNIQELIEEYEVGKIILAMAEEGIALEFECESEETEVKKDIDWVIQEIHTTRKVLADSESSGNETADEFTFNNGKEEGLVIALKLLDQLDEPEVLSQEWIDEHAKAVTYDGIPDQTEVVYVDELQNLLVPKQELPTIPEFVEEFLIGKEDYMLYELLDDEWLYKEHNRVAKWLYDNDELTNKQREIDLVMARERGYTVEKEQKYYVEDSGGRTILAKMTYSHKGKTFDKVEPYNELVVGYKKELTEQEIKDYDERFWPFRKPVEELEK